MGKIAEDFERFLYANYPDDYRRATAEDVPDDVITAILSCHSAHYDVWKRIPEWIRDEYKDDIPQEVLDGNVRVETFINEEYEKLSMSDPTSENSEDSKSAKDAEFVAGITVAFLAAGYSAESVSRLAKNHGERNNILKQMKIHGRTPELVAAWYATREDDIKTRSNEYDKNEKFIHKKVLRLAKQLSKMKRSKESYDEEEYKKIEENLISAIEFIKNDPDAKMKVFEHLKGVEAQKAMSFFAPEVKDKFFTLMKDVGISIKPNDGKPRSFEINRDTLVEGLKKDFAERLKLEKILSNKFGYKVADFVKVKAQDVVGLQPDDKIDKLVMINKGESVSVT